LNTHLKSTECEASLPSGGNFGAHLALCVLSVVIGTFSFAPSASADVGLYETDPTFGFCPSGLCIKITGTITKNDEALLSLALAKVGKGPTVTLASPGGEVLPALRMGRLLRSAKALTHVVGSCSSACVFLLASGVDRAVIGTDSRVGLHRPTFPAEIFASLSDADARRHYDKLTEDCRKYLREMGMDDKLFADMLRVPSQEIRFVGAEYCASVSLTGVDPVYSELGRARAIKRWGRDFVERREAATKCAEAGDNMAFFADCYRRFGITVLNPESKEEAREGSLEREVAESGAVKQSTGLFYKEITAGEGASPKTTDRVTIHYRAALSDGTIFDSSFDRHKPATFPLGGVIPCWTQGLQLMRTGGNAVLVCPPALAYGDAGRPPKVPGGATLVFEIELLSIEK
jgi:FKBP-type peptidyl-prolyl cis-trans isomerase